MKCILVLVELTNYNIKIFITIKNIYFLTLQISSWLFNAFLTKILIEIDSIITKRTDG